MTQDGISVDENNNKYRQFIRGDDLLEYTLDGGEISVDWVCGRDAASMMKAILEVDGDGITQISGYVTDKLGRASDAALQRLGQQMAAKIGDGWRVKIELIEGRRYLMFSKRERR